MMIQSKDDINYKRIGAHLKRLRQAKGETQKEVAADLNMEYTSYSNYERGSEKFLLWRIAQLCERYEVSLGSVLDDCSPAFLPEWHSGTPASDEYNTLLEQLRQECYRLSPDQIRLLLTLAKELNKKRKKV